MADIKPSEPIQEADGETSEPILAAYHWHVYVIFVVRVGNKTYILMVRHPRGNDLGLPGGTMRESVAEMALLPNADICPVIMRNGVRECWEELGDALMSPAGGKPLLCVEDLRPLAPCMVPSVYRMDGQTFRCTSYYFCLDVTERLAERTGVCVGAPAMESAKAMASDPKMSPISKERAKEFAGLEFVEYGAVVDGTTDELVWDQQLSVLQSRAVQELVRACAPAAPPPAAWQSRLSDGGGGGSGGLGSEHGRGAGDDRCGDGWEVPRNLRRSPRRSAPGGAGDRQRECQVWPDTCDREAYLRGAAPVARNLCFLPLAPATVAAAALVATAASATAAVAAAIAAPRVPQQAPRAPRQAALCRHFSSKGFCDWGTACRFRHEASVHGGGIRAPARGGSAGAAERSASHPGRAW